MLFNLNVSSWKRSTWISNGILATISLGLFYFFAPVVMNEIVFKGILLKLPYLFLLVPSGFFLWFLDKKTNYLSVDRRPMIILISLLVVNFLWGLFIYTCTDYLTYKRFAKFEKTNSMVATDLGMVRYNARPVAFVDMENSITAATEQISFDDSRPVVLGDRFGFIAPITPDGTLVTFTQKNPGFVFFDDSYGPDKKVNRLNQQYEIGQGMQIFDNLERHLYLTDFFADYESPHYLALDPKSPMKFTAVVPRIKYSWWLMPYWAGVVLVHDDGTIEELSKDEALADNRLKGKWIFPMELTKKYIELQNYGVGWGPLGPFVRVPGKLEIEKLPGENQYPFLMQGGDDHTYHYAATKAEGAGAGLFRMYYVDSSTGEGYYFEYDKNDLVYGASAFLKRIQNLGGYNWYRRSGDGSSGNMIAIEPVYIVKPGDTNLYWKASITNKEFAGTSAIVVSSASDLDNIMEFKDRVQFEAWKNGGVYAGPIEDDEAGKKPTKADEVRQIQALLMNALDRLSRLEK